MIASLVQKTRILLPINLLPFMHLAPLTKLDNTHGVFLHGFLIIITLTHLLVMLECLMCTFTMTIERTLCTKSYMIKFNFSSNIDRT